MTAMQGPALLERAWVPPAFALAYFLAAMLGDALSIEPGHFATLWPPSGLYLAVLLSMPRRRGTIVVAAVAANLAFDVGLHGRALPVALGFAAANSAEALAGAAVIGRFFGPPFRLGSVSEVLALTALAALAGPAVGALLGSAVVNTLLGGNFGHTFTLWWGADSIGIISAAPLTMLALHDYGQRRLAPARALELGALFAALAAITYVVVQVLGSVTSYGYLLIPVMLWAALRFGLPGAALAVSVLALFAAWLTALGDAPRSVAQTAADIVGLQLFLATLGLSTYVVAVLVSQLRLARTHLEERVAQRTAELTVSEERLRLAAEVGRMFAFDWDSESGKVTRSAGADRVLHIAQGGERDSGRDYLRRIRREDRQRYHDTIVSLTPQAPEYELRYILRLNDGSDVVLQERGRAYFDAHGKMTKVHGMSADVTAQARLEQALHEQEAEFRQVANSAPAILWITDSRGCVRFVSSGWQDFTGQIEVDALGMGWLEVVHPDDRELVRARYDAAMRQRREVMLSYRLRRADGSYSWVMDRARARYSTTGELLGYVGSTMDVSEQKRIEVELQQSRQRLGLALAAGRMGTFDWDLRDGSVTLDAVQRELIGVTQDVLHIDALLEMVVPEDRPGVDQAIAESLRHGEYAHEFRIRHSDGSVRWLAARGGLRRGAGGAQALMGLSWDATERKEQEAMLRRSEARLRHTVESAQVGIAFGDAGGGIVECNDALLRMLAMRRGQPDGGAHSWHRFFSGQDERLAQAVEAVARGESIGPVELALKRADGTTLEALWSMVPLDHEPGAHVAMLVDLTELKRAEQALREADRRKDEYLAILAHELRNPLAPIRNAANILALAQPSEAQSKWARELIARQVEQLSRLIDDLLDVSRISRGKLVLNKSPTTLAAVIDAAVESCAPLIARHGHRLRVQAPPAAIPLQADLVRLAQVFVNLISNAAKYTPHGGGIDIEVEQGVDEVAVRVRDNGIGIPPDKLPRLFEMFYQVDSSLERAHGGLGIGLTLVQRLVHLHGGQVTASSAGVGCGSVFCVRLPVLHSLPMPTLANAPAPHRRGGARRVLVADDNVDSAESLALLLRMNGDEVFVAYDGQAALDLLQRHAPEVALLDIGMPRLNGYEVARRARASACGRSMLMIALTGWGQAEDVRRSLEAGFDAHMTKPLDLARLQALLAERFAPRPG